MGGAYPHWSKGGKTWRGLGPLKNHLNILSHIGRQIYEELEAEVVEYWVSEPDELNAKPLSEFNTKLYDNLYPNLKDKL